MHRGISNGKTNKKGKPNLQSSKARKLYFKIPQPETSSGGLATESRCPLVTHGSLRGLRVCLITAVKSLQLNWIWASAFAQIWPFPSFDPLPLTVLRPLQQQRAPAHRITASLRQSYKIKEILDYNNSIRYLNNVLFVHRTFACM